VLLTFLSFLVASAGLVFAFLRGRKGIGILEFAGQVGEKFPDRCDCLKIQAGLERMDRIGE
jgi:hypothetical protein